jgi:Skp family chaperone for outer membrane proteins
MKMMQTRTVVLAVCVAAVAGLAVPAARSATARFAPPATVVAVVDMQKAINGLDELKARNDANQKKADARVAELTKIRDEIKKQNEELEKSAQMAPAGSNEIMNKRADLMVRAQTLDAQANAYKQLTRLDAGDVLRDMHAKVMAGIDALAKREGIDLVIADDRALEIPSPGSDEEVGRAINAKRVLFVSPTIDLTQRVLTQVNNDFNAGKKK